MTSTLTWLVCQVASHHNSSSIKGVGMLCMHHQCVLSYFVLMHVILSSTLQTSALKKITQNYRNLYLNKIINNKPKRFLAFETSSIIT